MASTAETPQGTIVGRLVSSKSELTDKKCANFNAIPFATYKRFERPQPYGNWKGTLDGTGNVFVHFCGKINLKSYVDPFRTPRQVQYNSLLEESDGYDLVLGRCLFPDNLPKLYHKIPGKNWTTLSQDWKKRWF